MPTFRTVEVTEVLSERPGLQRVRVAGAPHGDRAYCLTELTGPVAPGDRVVVNTTAVELGLGTGGWHVVHWNLARETVERPGPDHIMKLRYTSLQFDAGTDELAHPELPETLAGTVVVATMVHSQVAAVAAVLKHLVPDIRIGYVMTDGAALPIALSDLVADLRDRGLVDATVTTGHAFGGDLEAVSVASGLLLGRHVGGADVLIAGMGPGVVGTGTRYGTTAVEVAPILDTTDALGGEPVLCVRASSGDPRDRHRGVSHHSRTVVELARCRPWVPDRVTDDGLPGTRSLPVAPVDTVALLQRLGLRVTTMGRLPEDDPLFFDVAGATAALAATLWQTTAARRAARADTEHAPAVDKLERILNLTALLLETRRPLSAEEIRRQIDGYPDRDDSFRRTFERDKDDLRDMGIPLETVTVPGTDPPRAGYVIPPERYYLADPGLTAEESAALQVAAVSIRLGGDDADSPDELDAVRKLGGREAPAEPGDTLVAIPTSPALAEIFGALGDRRVVRFRYGGVDRAVRPYRLDFVKGRWYLSGFDEGRDDERRFRLDRFESGVEVGEPGAYERPDHDVGLALEPWQLGEGEPIAAELLVDADQVSQAVSQLPADTRWVHAADGSAVATIPIVNVAAFRSFVLTFLDHAEILGPPPLRQDMVDWLTTMATGRP